MKLAPSVFAVMAFALGLLCASGCSAEIEDDKYPDLSDQYMITATLRTDPATDKFYLQVYENTRLYPTNIEKHPFDGQTTRVYGLISLPGQQNGKIEEIREGQCKVHSLEKILTKQIADDKGAANVAQYGDDPIDILDSWETGVEDGFITLRFRTAFGNTASHYISMVKVSDSPVTLRLFHSRNGDPALQDMDGLIAFDLSSLPDTQGATAPLTLVWRNGSGQVQTLDLEYKTRKED